MTQYSFTVGEKYKREHVSHQAGDGGDIGGNWATGYPQKNGVTFIFSNVGNPGQTGHDYDNYFDGQDLIWRGRTGSHRNQPSIIRMTTPGSEVHVFWRTGGRELFTYGGMGTAIEITDEIPVRIRWRLSTPSIARLVSAERQRFLAAQLNKVRPEHIWEAVELLIAGYTDHRFSPSTDYDVVTDEGDRLAPKVVFGVAVMLALGLEATPANFTAGVGSRCFTTIERAGFRIVRKNEQPSESPPIPEDEYWTEGNKKLASHMKRERSSAASRAKKSQFKALHGKLFCEKCGLVPVEHYATTHAESCIEVHHRYVQVQEMTENHRTTLDMLQCLCANCHRLEHRLLKEGPT